jgi:hypothetical protein
LLADFFFMGSLRIVCIISLVLGTL